MASEWFPQIERTGHSISVGGNNCEVVKIFRLPFQVRIQECTRRQALQLVRSLVEFVIESLPGRVPADIHEGNFCWWNGLVFVDLDAFQAAHDEQAAMAFVRIAYLLLRYVSGVSLVAHDRFDLVQLRRYEGWMSDVARGRKTGFNDIELWTTLRSMLDRLSVTNTATHWSDEYAAGGGHPAKLAAVAELVPPAATLLDLGCNKGYVTAMLADRFNYGLGVDVDEACIDLATEQYGCLKLNFARVDVDVFSQAQPVQIHTRFHADVVLALALTHHLDRAGHSVEYVAGLLARLSRDYLVVEDIVHVAAYAAQLRAHGFEVEQTVPSVPSGRTLTLWRKN